TSTTASTACFTDPPTKRLPASKSYAARRHSPPRWGRRLARSRRGCSIHRQSRVHGASSFAATTNRRDGRRTLCSRRHLLRTSRREHVRFGRGGSACNCVLSAAVSPDSRKRPMVGKGLYRVDQRHAR